jgi:hypothetical protein
MADESEKYRKVRRFGVRHGQGIRIGESIVRLMVRRREDRDHYTLVVAAAPETPMSLLDRLFSDWNNEASQ